jgi:hypothetical protein
MDSATIHKTIYQISILTSPANCSTSQPANSRVAAPAPARRLAATPLPIRQSGGVDRCGPHARRLGEEVLFTVAKCTDNSEATKSAQDSSKNSGRLPKYKLSRSAVSAAKRRRLLTISAMARCRRLSQAGSATDHHQSEILPSPSRPA